MPKDVVLSENLTGGDANLLEKEPYADKPASKINYKDIFGQSSSAAQPEKEKEKEKPKAEPAKKRKAEARDQYLKPFSCNWP